tara:strand:- start:2085 stop:4931 length:2847 start_codon:yes stop_codon:yes gene_type:complete
MGNIEKLRELFDSGEYEQVEVGINLVKILNDKQIYAKCLSGWTFIEKERNGSHPEVLLKFNQNTLDKELSSSGGPVIKDVEWSNKSRGYAVLSILESAIVQVMEYNKNDLVWPDDVNVHPSLDLSKITTISLKGVGFKYLPSFLKKCKSLEKIDINECDQIVAINDSSLLDKIFNFSVGNVLRIIEKINCDTSEMVKILQKEYNHSLNEETYDFGWSIKNSKYLSHYVGNEGFSFFDAFKLLNNKSEVSIVDGVNASCDRDAWSSKINLIVDLFDKRKNKEIVQALSLLQTKGTKALTNSTKVVIDYYNSCIDGKSLTFSSSPPKIDWKSVEVAAVVNHILTLSLKEEPKVLLNEDWEGWYLNLLDKIVSESELWFLAIISCAKMSTPTSVIGPQGWTPKILWDGSVAFRNHHRVIAPKYMSTVFFTKEKIKQFLIDINKISVDERVIVTTLSGEITEVQDATKISEKSMLNGNNFISIIGHSWENCSEFVKRYIAFAYQNTRAGVMLRVVNNGISFYSDYRADDKFDFLLENADVLSFFPEERPTQDEDYNTRVIVSSEDSKTPAFTFESETYFYKRVLENYYWDQYEQAQYSALWPSQKNMEIGTSLVEKTFKSSIDSTEETIPAGSSLLKPHDFIFANLASFMLKNYAYNDFPKIFGTGEMNYNWTNIKHNKDSNWVRKNNISDFPRVYSGTPLLHTFFRDYNYNVSFDFRMGNDVQRYSLNWLSDFPHLIINRILSRVLEMSPVKPVDGFNKYTEWINDDACVDPKKSKKLFYDQIRNVENICLHCRLPKDQNIDYHSVFGDRVLDTGKVGLYSGHTSEENFVWVQLNLVKSELGNNEFNLVIDKNDASFIEEFINNYVENDLDGDWTCLAENFYYLFRLYIKMPEAAYIDFDYLGKELTNPETKEIYGDEFEGLLSDFIGINIPDAGIYQAFDYGDYVSGNMF